MATVHMALGEGRLGTAHRHGHRGSLAPQLANLRNGTRNGETALPAAKRGIQRKRGVLMYVDCHTRAGDLKDMHGTLGSNPIEYPETANTRPRAPAHWCATSPRPASQNPIIGRPGSERPTQSQHLSTPSALPLPPPTDTPPRFTGEPDTRGRDSPPPHDSLYGQSLRVIACAGG